MANFMDLPKPVRETIYRLHLIADEQPVTFEAYKQACGAPATIGDHENMDLETLRLNRVKTSKDGKYRTMPTLLQVNDTIEREAAEIYYGENTFAFWAPGSLSTWELFVLPRHLKLARKVVLLTWTLLPGASANDAFRKLGALPQLESLTVAVNERRCLENFTIMPKMWHPSLGFGRQIALQSYHLQGITGLRSLRGLREVKFFKSYTATPDENPGDVGTLPGGLLETTIKHEMMLSRSFNPQKTKNILLVFDGPTYPVSGKPISVTSQIEYVRHNKTDEIPVPLSALEILLVNRQLHKEAHSLFYKENSLVFSAPKDLLSFTQSLGDSRLASVREVTCFYDNVFQGAPSRSKTKRTVKSAFGMVSRFKNLRKLHLCIGNLLVTPDTLLDSSANRSYMRDPTTLPSVETLFTLRDIPDIKIRDLNLEDCDEDCRRDFQGWWGETNSFATDNPWMDLDEYKKLVRQHLDRHRARLKHFNHDLQLAQNGTNIDYSRYTQKGWYENSWRLLPETPCGPNGTCSCGDGQAENEAEDDKSLD